jgi:hypothetical protein
MRLMKRIHTKHILVSDANNQDTTNAHALHPPTTTKVILYYFFVKLTIATSITHLRFQILLTRVISAGLVLKMIKLDLLEIVCVMLFFYISLLNIASTFFWNLMWD